MRQRRIEVCGYWVVYERDADGWLVAEVPALPGCHTQARNMHDLRNRIAEAISLFDSRSEAGKEKA